MFRVFGITIGNCDGADSHTEREVYMAEDLMMKTSLYLCQKCFHAQMKLRCKGKKSDSSEATRLATQP